MSSKKSSTPAFCQSFLSDRMRSFIDEDYVPGSASNASDEDRTFAAQRRLSQQGKILQSNSLQSTTSAEHISNSSSSSTRLRKTISTQRSGTKKSARNLESRTSSVIVRNTPRDVSTRTRATPSCSSTPAGSKRRRTCGTTLEESGESVHIAASNQGQTSHPIPWFVSDANKKSLPSDLFYHALQFLPAIGDLLRYQSVSRLWRDAIAVVAERVETVDFTGVQSNPSNHAQLNAALRPFRGCLTFVLPHCRANGAAQTLCDLPSLMPNITSLSLSGTAVKSSLVPILKAFGRQLETLDLYDCHIGRNSPFSDLGFSHFERLRHLSIGRNPCPFAPFLALCVGVGLLSLNLVGFTHEARRPSTYQLLPSLIPQLGDFVSLTHLILNANCFVGRYAVIDMASNVSYQSAVNYLLASLPHLRALYLSYCHGVGEILVGHDRLEALVLSRCDVERTYVVSDNGFPMLRTLDVSWTKLPPGDIMQLLATSRCLTTLDASGSLCNDSIAAFITTDAPSLKHVSFDSCRSMSRASRLTAWTTKHHRF